MSDRPAKSPDDWSPEQGLAWSGGFRAGADAQREAYAALVEAAGCLCLDEVPHVRTDFDAIARLEVTRDGPEYRELMVVDIHDPRCPVALAAKIRGRA